MTARSPGDEYLAYADDGSGRENVTMMVQVPASFDREESVHRHCAVVRFARRLWRDRSAGEWGLKKGCAVAYTDKGTGNGAHDLQANTVNLIDGSAREPTKPAKRQLHCVVSPQELADFNAATPNRFAFKHAHSQQNPESEWGRDVLDPSASRSSC